MTSDTGFITKRDVAARIHKSIRSVTRLMDDGIIPYLKLGSEKQATILFDWEDVKAALKARYQRGGQN